LTNMLLGILAKNVLSFCTNMGCPETLKF